MISVHFLASLCPDGTWKRACYPTMSPSLPLDWTCVCQSAGTSDVRATYWSGWEDLSPPVGEAHFTRRLMMEGGECITREFNLVWRPVVSGYNLLNNAFTASHTQASSYPVYKARVDAYWDDGGCAWVPPTITDPYLLITLPTPFRITGIYLNKGCASAHPTVVSVTTSNDGASLLDVAIQVNPV